MSYVGYVCYVLFLVKSKIVVLYILCFLYVYKLERKGLIRVCFSILVIWVERVSLFVV